MKLQSPPFSQPNAFFKTQVCSWRK